MASDRAPPRNTLAPPPGEGARFDTFERETLKGLNDSLRGTLTLSRESNRILVQLSDVLGKMHETSISIRDLITIEIAEHRLTREIFRELRDEIALLRAERTRERRTQGDDADAAKVAG